MNSPQLCEQIHLITKTENPFQNYEKKFAYRYNFDIKYEILAPIIKDMQMVSQLIKCKNNQQLSDLIIIYGSNSYTKDSRFYFNYRHIIDFYVKIIEFSETINYTKIKYHIYKTGPISKKFFVVLSLCKNEEKENSSKLNLDIILSKDSIISQLIIKIIYNEFNYNYSLLSEAIKTKKHLSCFYISTIIKNEFYILSQIMQNIKLIEYIINCRLTKINTCEKKEGFNNEDKFIHLNDNYEINFNKKKEIKEWISLNNISLNIQILNSIEDRMTIKFKINKNNQEIIANKDNQVDNFILVHLRKLTNNNCFLLFKSSLDENVPNEIIKELEKIMTKSMRKIGKLCQMF